METIELIAQERKEIGKKVKKLRESGSLPAIVYGKDYKTLAVIIDRKSYKKAISGEAGTNVIITLNISDGKNESLPVISQEIQRNPLTDEIIHVDFHKINMKEKIQTRIPIEIIGEAAGVKEEGGILIHALTELEIKCLPMDIPDKVKIEVSHLKINDSVPVSELKKLIKGDVEIITPETETVVNVVPPAKEEVAPPPEVPVGEAVVAAEGAEAAEGAAAPAEKTAPAADKATAPKSEK